MFQKMKEEISGDKDIRTYSSSASSSSFEKNETPPPLSFAFTDQTMPPPRKKEAPRPRWIDSRSLRRPSMAWVIAGRKMDETDPGEKRKMKTISSHAHEVSPSLFIRQIKWRGQYFCNKRLFTRGKSRTHAAAAAAVILLYWQLSLAPSRRRRGGAISSPALALKGEERVNGGGWGNGEGGEGGAIGRSTPISFLLRHWKEGGGGGGGGGGPCMMISKDAREEGRGTVLPAHNPPSLLFP